VVEGHIPEIEEHNWKNISLEEHFEFYINKGIDRKEAIKLIAKDRELPKREIYEQLMKK
jgi:16S rRNA (cytidine1402-2'-O)-methyltransferase